MCDYFKHTRISGFLQGFSIIHPREPEGLAVNWNAPCRSFVIMKGLPDASRWWNACATYYFKEEARLDKETHASLQWTC